MGLFGTIGNFIGGKTNKTDVKKEEREFEKTQKYIKEVEENIEKQKNLKFENKLKDIKLEDIEKKLNWKDLKNKLNVENGLKDEELESEWDKLDKMLEDI